ncbi:myosin-11 isoform X2 [Cajanus cajan]|uniref:myosin-11 isoform X2 n=1 Tax=Cajanus cajan TaxID=3821 RepID=UPI0010FB7C96|nr:myosin-11 isoform X2 [Cajanus cajan]
MFRLHKHRAPKSGDKIEFRISHLKALQVPKGWDKLFVSVVSVENGKTIAKSNKVPVRNGGCQWSDTFSESIWVSRDGLSKGIDDGVLKLIVAMGSSRSGILGEATVSLTSYMSSGAAIPLSIPLNKCNHGTVLHVTVQCLTPRSKLSETNFHLKAINENNYDQAVKSNESDCSNVQSVESSSVEDFDSMLSLGEVETRETSFSGSVSNCSHNSTEGSTGRGNISPCTSDGQSPIGRQDSTSSQKSVSHHDYPVNDSSQSNNSPFNSQKMQDIGALSSKTTNAYNNRLEAAEDTSEELRAEAKMWEMNARKLMGDLDMLRTEFSDQSKKLEGMEMDLSAAQVERDSLKKEVEQLKLSFEDPIVRQKASEDSVSHGECIPEIENALKEELKFEKESNANLSLQLKRSQEANVEFVSVLQELEETIEQQKIEIENLSSLPSKFSDLEESFQQSIEGNKRLKQQLEQLEESKKNLLVKVQELEGALEDKMRDTESAKIQNNKTLSDIEMEYESKLYDKDKEISSLKAKLFESIPENCIVETVPRNLADVDLLREIEVLKEKVEELEIDCNELTEENLELLFKLKEAKKNSKDGGACEEDLFTDKLKDQSSTGFGSEVSNNLFRIFPSEDTLQGKNDIKSSNDHYFSIQELESSKLALEVRITDLNKDLTDKTSVIGNLEANLSYKEKEIGVQQKLLSELKAKVYRLEQEKIQLEKHMEAMIKENKHELELHISDIEQEKQQLSIHVSVLEDQLRDLTNDQEFCLSELESSRSQAARFQEKIMEMESEIDSSTEDFKQKLKVAQIRWSEAQEECEYLRGANQKLQITAEKLEEECSSFEKLNGDLRQQNLKLEEYCSLVGDRLRESDEKFVKCSKRVELLEKKLTLMVEDIASKEKHLTSDLDNFFDENRKHIEQGQVLLNQMQMEKMVETQNLELEVEKLSLKLSAAYDEKESIASNALLEVSTLRADKAKLESALEEAQSKVVLAKNEVEMMQTQYEQKLKDLTTQLAEYKIKMEMMMSEHEKLLNLAEDHKSRELKLKSTINALELKLTVSEYERQQIMDESGNLKVKLQKTHEFENEIIALKKELSASNSEKERLEASLGLTSELCEDLKAEKTSSGLKILALEKAASELEDCKRTRASLEERLVQLDNDLKARETRCVQDTELSHSKRINRQHQQTIQLLEQEKVELQTKAQALEEELKLIKEQKRNQVSKLNRKCLPVHDDLKASKSHVVKNTNQHRSNRKKSFKNDREIMKDQQEPCYGIKHQSEVETELGLLDENVHAIEVDPLPKTQLLETELAKAEETNDRSPSQGRNNQANGPVKSMVEELVTKEIFERTKSILEEELRDIQERYFHMSLKYAQVEAEREELVMKLKATKNKKGWLS